MIFRYQKFMLRLLWGLPLLYVCVRLHITLGEYVESMLLYYLLGAVIVVPLAALYIRLTESWPLFVGEASFEVQEDMLLIRTGNRIRVLKGITEVYGWDTGVYGSFMSALQIRCGGGAIKFFSVPHKRGETLSDTELYPLFLKAVSMGEALEQQRDIHGNLLPYHYKKPEQ